MKPAVGNNPGQRRREQVTQREQKSNQDGGLYRQAALSEVIDRHPSGETVPDHVLKSLDVTRQLEPGVGQQFFIGTKPLEPLG